MAYKQGAYSPQSLSEPISLVLWQISPTFDVEIETAIQTVVLLHVLDKLYLAKGKDAVNGQFQSCRFRGRHAVIAKAEERCEKTSCSKGFSGRTRQATTQHPR